MEKKMTVGELKEILENFDEYDSVAIVDYNNNFPYSEIYYEATEIGNRNGIFILGKGDFI